MSQTSEISFTGTELFSGSICALTQIYNVKTQQRSLIPKFKNELVRSIVSGDWEHFNQFDGLTKLVKTTGIPSLSLENDNKIVVFFDENKAYIGKGISFNSRPESYEGYTRHQMRMAKLFAIKDQNDCKLTFDVEEMSSESTTYLQILNVCEIFISELIVNIIRMNDDDFTINMFGHTINGIEIMSYIALKSLSNRIVFDENEYKNKLDKDSKQTKLDKILDSLKITYKLHDYICRIVLLDFTLESFKWYTFIDCEKAKSLIKGGHKAIFAVDKDGLIVKHKSPVNTVINMQNKDTITYTVRSKDKAYTFGTGQTSRSVDIDMSLNF